MWNDASSFSRGETPVDWTAPVATVCGKSVRIIALDAKDIERDIVGVCLIDYGRVEFLGKFDLGTGDVLSTYLKLVNI